MLAARRFICSALAIVALAGCSGGGAERTPLTMASQQWRHASPQALPQRVREGQPDIRLKWVVLEENIPGVAMAMTNNIVVLRTGRIEQVVAPLDVYRQPAAIDDIIPPNQAEDKSQPALIVV